MSRRYCSKNRYFRDFLPQTEFGKPSLRVLPARPFIHFSAFGFPRERTGEPDQYIHNPCFRLMLCRASPISWRSYPFPQSSPQKSQYPLYPHRNASLNVIPNSFDAISPTTGCKKPSPSSSNFGKSSFAGEIEIQDRAHAASETSMTPSDRRFV
jgi:hypothetical protein